MNEQTQGGRALLRPTPDPVALTRLLPGRPDVPPDLMVGGVSQDSRSIAPGDLYIALGGANAHGADFAADAVDRGAVAVLTDAVGADRARVPAGLPVLVVAVAVFALVMVGYVVYQVAT